MIDQSLYQIYLEIVGDMLVYLPDEGVVFMRLHVVVEVGLGTVQLPAHLTGMLP